MREGYGSCFVSVSVCAYYHASCYIPPHSYVENKAPISFLCHFYTYCVDFVENINTLFKISGNICLSPLPSSLLDRLLMDKTDSDGFFSRWLMCRSCNRSYYLTVTSLVIVNCQLGFLTWNFLHVY